MQPKITAATTHNLGWISNRKLLFLIIILAVLLRLGVAMYFGDAITEIRGGTFDQFSYDALAQRVANGYGFTFAEDSWPSTPANEPTAHWSYLYTIFLAVIYRVFGYHPLIARIIQVVIVGILMPLFIFRIGRQIFDEKIGLIAAAIIAIYAYFITYAGSLMTESLYIVGILWCFDIVLRISSRLDHLDRHSDRLDGSTSLRFGIELGASFGITLLLRQVIVPFLVILAIWLLWYAWRQGDFKPVLPIILIAWFSTVLLIAPFLIHNYRTFGRVTFLPNTNSGFALFWSNHPIYGTNFVPALSWENEVSYQDLIPTELRGLNELELERALLIRGLKFIWNDPERYLLLSISRIPIYFQFWPTPNSTLLSNVARILSFGLFLPFMVLGLLLVIRKYFSTKKRPGESTHDHESTEFNPSYVFLILLFVIIYSGIHIASWANVRYRLPVDAILIIFATYAINWLIQKRHKLVNKS